MFMLRRIIYALVIVFMDKVMYYGVFIVMLSCLAMLAFACTEHQWKDRIINYQHIFDECTIYIICLILLCYSSFVTSEMRWLLGWVLIGICFVYVIFNTIVIIYYALCLMWLFIKRIFIQCRKREKEHAPADRQNTPGLVGELDGFTHHQFEIMFAAVKFN